METVEETVGTLEAEIAKDLDAYKKIQATNQATSDVLQHQYTTWKQGFDALTQQKALEQAALEALQVKTARAAELKTAAAAKATKAGTGDYTKWVLEFIGANQSPNEDEGLDYNYIAEVAFKSGVVFPLNKAGKTELKNVKKLVNKFLDRTSKLWNPIPKVRKTQAGHYRLTATIGAAQPTAQSAPQDDRETVRIKGGGPRDVPNEVYFEVVKSLVPTLLAQGPMVDTTFALNLFRDECKRQNIRFKGKEKVFNHYFFLLCAPGGPLDCWKRVGSSSGTEIYQKAGSPAPLGEGWKIVTPEVPALNNPKPQPQTQAQA